MVSVLYVQHNPLPLTDHPASYGQDKHDNHCGGKSFLYLHCLSIRKSRFYEVLHDALAGNVVAELGIELSPSKLGELTRWTQ